MSLSHTKYTKILNPGTKINDFIIIDHIGHGGYGEIYRVIDTTTARIHAMKLERYRPYKCGLNNEIEILQNIKGDSFTHLIKSGFYDDSLQYMIMNVYLPSIHDIWDAHHGKFDITAAFHTSLKMLSCITQLHSLGIIHLDIKAANFLMNYDQQSPLVLIDFGMSQLISWPKKSIHLVGTKRYASIRNHKHEPLGPGDDLISWFFVSLEMIYPQGLPWKHLDDYELILQSKQNWSQKLINHSKYFMKMYEYLKCLEMDDLPNYHYVEYLLKKEMNRRSIAMEFDWLYFIKTETEIIITHRNHKRPKNSIC